VETIQIPFRWYPKEEILKGYLAWRLINLDESEGQPIDRVIALKFPAFVVKHSHKTTWLVQQFRQLMSCSAPSTATSTTRQRMLNCVRPFGRSTPQCLLSRGISLRSRQC